MPSDERTQRVLDALSDRVAAFRGALAAAREEIDAYLVAHRARRGSEDAGTSALLGAFAVGRIDVTRFGALLADRRVLTAAAEERLAECSALLEDMLARGDALCVCEVPRGGDLREVVARQLAKAGRAFGAARVFQAVKAGTFDADRDAMLLHALPYARWTRVERELAPPLVVAVHGADLRGELLAEFLDGNARIVVVVEGTASPAPLVRLITPGLFVAQGAEPSALTTLAGFTGPAVVALVPEPAADFVHDPRAGARLDDRLTIASLPAELPRHALGARSARQLGEELAQLSALREVAKAARELSVVVVPPEPGGVGDDARAVDAVATWMLAQAGFDGARR